LQHGAGVPLMFLGAGEEETEMDGDYGYNAPAACEHCEGIIGHERWCQTLNPVVCYARKIVGSADELAIGDAIILHSLGVLWDYCHI
jgi:hypothetical protein